jgi:hypothetical protein
MISACGAVPWHWHDARRDSANGAFSAFCIIIEPRGITMTGGRISTKESLFHCIESRAHNEVRRVGLSDWRSPVERDRAVLYDIAASFVRL